MGLQRATPLILSLFIALGAATSASGAVPQAREIWSAKMGALVTDLDMTPDGRRILLAARSDADAAPAEPTNLREKPARGSYVVMLNARGKELWRKLSDYPIKSQSLSATGDRAVVVTYDSHLTVYDGTGKKLWSIPSNCLPRAIAASRHIYCFHDDDLDPAIAFETYDWNGKKLGEWKVPGPEADLLAISFDDAEKRFAATYSDGTIEVFGGDGAFSYRKKITGEIVDASFAADGRLLVLAQERTGSRVQKRIVSLDLSGNVEFSEEIRDSAQKVLSMLPKNFVVTSNHKDGQTYRLFALGEPKARRGGSADRAIDLVSQVKYAQQTIVNYPVRKLGPGFLFVLEKLVLDDRVSQVSWIGADGTSLADWPLSSAKGAYLYTLALAPKTRTLVIAMDDGTVKLGKF